VKRTSEKVRHLCSCGKRLGQAKLPKAGNFAAMRMTVLVPTYRRPADLARCLAAIDAQTRPADQIVIVRRNDDAESKAVLDAYTGERLNVAISNVPGVVAALNAGLDRVDADIVAITDDDAAPRPDWLARIEAHFATRPEVGGIGGRDFVAGNTQLEQQRVGILQWFGRSIHNHHLGVGEPRYVEFLKGVNMSYRTAAIAGRRFDPRLRGAGAQVHNELMFSLEVSRAGWKLLYDPAVAVDHFPAQRFDEDARHQPTLNAVYDAAFNETLTLLEHLPARERAFFWIYSLAYGTRDLPGIGQCIRLLRSRPGIWRRFPYVLRGRLAARRQVRPREAHGAEALRPRPKFQE
jgi:GT2 family glycosyltransferase